MENFKGIEDVNQDLLEAQIRDFFNNNKYREPTTKEMATYYKFFVKKTDDDLLKETKKRFQRDRYCAEGHRLLKTTSLNMPSLCKICNFSALKPFGWACEVPTCNPICNPCYVELFGEERVQSTPIWRFYDYQGNLTEKANHNFPACLATHELRPRIIAGENFGPQCTSCGTYIENGKEAWNCIEGGYCCSMPLCVECFLKSYGQDGYDRQKARAEAGLIGTKGNVVKGANQKIVTPLCDQKHKLAFIKGKVYPAAKQHNCAKCSAQNIDESGGFWNCLKCSFDLCKPCSLEVWGDTIFLKAKSLLGLWDEETKFVCDDQGHPLIVIQGSLGSLDGTLDCSACGKYTLEKEYYYWGCDDCKYHLCKDCFKKSQQASPDDPKGKFARKIQKNRHFRNSILEHLDKIYQEQKRKEESTDPKYEYGDHLKPKYEHYLKAGLKTSKDSGLKKCTMEWTQALANVLVEECRKNGGKFSEMLLAASVFNQFVVASKDARRDNRDRIFLAKCATIFEDAAKIMIVRNCDFALKPPKEPCYFAGQVFDSGNQQEMLSKLSTQLNEKNIVKVAAKKTIPMSFQFVADMKEVLGKYSMKGKPIYAQCKYGKTIGDIDLPYNHGIRRSEMKYLEELASKPENKLKDFKNIRDKIIEPYIVKAEDLIKGYNDEMYNIISQVVRGEVPYNATPIPIVTRTFCQQDMLRCKAYFDSVESIKEVIDYVNQKYPLVRIKNRMGFLGDVMINFWYGDVVAEAQLVYHEHEEESEKQENDKDAKIRSKVNHFLYELERNPLGPLVHCAELLFKDAKQRQIDISKIVYDEGKNQFRQPVVLAKDLAVHTMEDGSEYHGDLLDGKRHGAGIEFYPDGTKYVGDFNNDVKSGQGKIEWMDGSSYEGQFANGMRNGKGVLKKGGYVYDGDWKDDKKHGRGKLTYPAHAKWDFYEGPWENDQKHGQSASVVVRGYYPLRVDFQNDVCEQNGLGPEF